MRLPTPIISFHKNVTLLMYIFGTIAIWSKLGSVAYIFEAVANCCKTRIIKAFCVLYRTGAKFG